MIETVTGDILSLEKGILVHGCNCRGVMGGGIAKQIRDKWPKVFDAYKHKYETSGLQLGDIVPVQSTRYIGSPASLRHLPHPGDPSLPDNLLVVNALTQDSYGQDPATVYVDYHAVFAAFARVTLLARDTGLDVHFPLIGCGLANGSWEKVSKMISTATDRRVRLTLWVLPQ